jgi:hypothetical protein
VPDDEDPPELRGYVAGDGRPLRHPVTMRVMRIVIVLGIAGLVVPTLVATIGLQARTAEVLCDRFLAASSSDLDGVARFELAGPAGPSWYCYGVAFDGREIIVASFGIIPG